jgi:LPS sulfotransferase NodH
LLSEALARTNIAGKPNEYFDIHDFNEQFWIRTLGISSNADYVDRVVAAASTANGVFGMKLLWHQLPSIVAKLNASAGRQSSVDGHFSLHALLSEKIGDPHYIWLRRENKLAQAISYYRASRTGLWRSVDTATDPHQVADHELPFDYAVIDQYLRAVSDFDARWYDYFSRNHVKVLMITYERFIETYAQTVHGLLEFLGIVRNRVTVTEPRLQRQADQRSLEWEQRFLEIRKASGATMSEQCAGQGLGVDGARKPNHAVTQAKRPKQKRVEQTGPPLLLTAYALTPQRPVLVTGPPNRDWMDVTTKRFPYRCLPMVIANQAGWLILNRHKFAVTWNGGAESNALKIQFLSGENPRSAVSIFGYGILTFTVGYLFRTPPGYNIYVHGPANSPKDGIAALEGIVESDWTEATFTMNWKVTRPNHPIVFEESEPIAMLTPVLRYELERFRPEIRNITDDPALEALYKEWATSRQRHNAELNIPISKAQTEGWQRHYMRGASIRSELAPQHQTSLVLKEFAEKTD